MITKHYNAANLAELRGNLTRQIAILLTFSSFMLLWLSFSQGHYPSARFFHSMLALIGLGLGVLMLLDISIHLARYSMVAGLSIMMFIAMQQFAANWLPFLGLPLLLVNVMLISYSGPPTLLLLIISIRHFDGIGSRQYPLNEIIMILVMTTILIEMTMRSLYLALDWTWNAQEHATRNLALSRETQAELRVTVKALHTENISHRRTRQHLVTARREAEKGRRLKEQFAASISHEFRTPLNIILGFSEVMYLTPEVYGNTHWPPALTRDIHHIYRSSQHLVAMINDLLDLSRFGIAEFTLFKELTDLSTLIENVAEITQHSLQADNITLDIQIEPDLPKVEIDRTRIRQCLINLVTNAQRYTPEGTITIAAQQDGEMIVVSVSDTGIGIPADKLLFIFDEFYQINSSLTRGNEGMGLGLPITKRFIEAHQGRIWVESEENVGTQFMFTLPTATIQSSGSIVYPRSVSRSANEDSPSILLVDHDPQVRLLLQRYLTSYHIVSVDYLEQLPDRIAREHPRLIINNVLPNQRVDYSPISHITMPVIECSLPSQAWSVDKLKVNACLIKPISARRLFEELDLLDDIQRVLIIDDDRAFVNLVERILSTMQRDIVLLRAYNGVEGLQLLAHQKPDLILLDLEMPVLDGFQVLEKLHQNPAFSQIPVILLTAGGRTGELFEDQGGQLVIQRPGGLYPVELLRALQAVVGALVPFEKDIEIEK